MKLPGKGRTRSARAGDEFDSLDGRGQGGRVAGAGVYLGGGIGELDYVLVTMGDGSGPV